MAFFATPAVGRPWYKRLTVVFGSLTAALVAVERLGIVPEGTATAVLKVGESLAGLAALLGLYRQVSGD